LPDTLDIIAERYSLALAQVEEILAARSSRTV
jgi:hypothetical protein